MHYMSTQTVFTPCQESWSIDQHAHIISSMNPAEFDRCKDVHSLTTKTVNKFVRKSTVKCMEILYRQSMFARKTTSDFYWIWKGQMPPYNVKRHWKYIGYRIFLHRYKNCIEVIQMQNSSIRYSNYKIRPGMAKVSVKTNTWTLIKAEMREYCDSRSQEKCRGAAWLLLHI